MRIVWTKLALRRLEEIEDYIVQHDRAAAARIVERIQETVESLSRTPYAGRVGTVPGTRELVIARTWSVVVYAIEQHRVKVIAVFHQRQRRPKSYVRDH